MIKFLRIRYKFLLIALLGIVAIIFMSLLAQNILDGGLKNLKKVYYDSKKVQDIQQRFIIPLFKLRETTLSYIVSPSEEEKREISSELTPLVEELDYSFNTLNGDIKDIWNNYKKLIFIKNGYKNYQRFVYLANGYLKHDNKTGAFLHTKNVERKQFYILISKLQKMQITQLEHSYKTFKLAKISFMKKEKIIIVGAFLIIFLTMLFGFLIARNIVFSLESVQSGLKRFFELLGRKIDKDEKIRIDITNRDEFGEIAKMINENIKSLKKQLQNDLRLIEDATNVVNDIKCGNLDKRLVEEASSSELNRLKDVMNEMIENLEERLLEEISERTKQEQLLIQQSKLASMGNMIGNIAHQWRQPLGEIGAILMNLQVKNEYGDLGKKVLEDSIDECNIILSHMSKTISDFQNFFKPSKEKVLFSVKDECKNACFIIESSLRYHNISFLLDIENESKVMGYPREFAQALLNILSNSKDALIERGVKEPFIKLTLKSGKKFVVVKVEDNAGGISKDIMDRIFEPYFTTKISKKGTGIGLYMSKIIIEDNMQGYINVKNYKNGALFRIKLIKYNI